MRSILLLAALVAASSLHAQTRFTFSGTDGNSQPVTLSIVTSGNPLASRQTGYAGAYYLDDFRSTNVDLFSSVSGTGITGTWARPSLDESDPYSELQINPATGGVYFYVGRDTSPSLSLSYLGMPIYDIYLNGYILETFASLPQAYDFANLWSNYHGTYTLDGETSQFQFVTTTTFETHTFTFNTLTIGPATPVPEPSTYGLALGGLALAVVALRKRNGKISK